MTVHGLLRLGFVLLGACSALLAHTAIAQAQSTARSVAMLPPRRDMQVEPAQHSVAADAAFRTLSAQGLTVMPEERVEESLRLTEFAQCDGSGTCSDGVRRTLNVDLLATTTVWKKPDRTNSLRSVTITLIAPTGTFEGETSIRNADLAAAASDAALKAWQDYLHANPAPIRETFPEPPPTRDPQASSGGPALGDYLVAGGLAALSIPFLTLGAIAAGRDGECIGDTDANGLCSRRADFGGQSIAYFAAAGVALAAGITVLLWQPFRIYGSASPHSASLHLHGEFLMSKITFCLVLLGLAATSCALVEGDKDRCYGMPKGTREVDGRCVVPDASTDGDDACGGCDQGTVCNEDTKACVECVTDANCTDAGKRVCNVEANECVQCTAEKADACGDNECTAAFTCSKYASATQLPCEPCDTDANCKEAMNKCVPMTYKGEAREDGYCLKSNADGCERPFGIDTPKRTSLSGAPADTYCGINENLTTCEALRALLSDTQCTTGQDSACPQPGGLCRKVGSLTNRCTYECDRAVQCDSDGNPGSTCGTGEGSEDDPSYCGG